MPSPSPSAGRLRRKRGGGLEGPTVPTPRRRLRSNGDSSSCGPIAEPMIYRLIMSPILSETDALGRGELSDPLCGAVAFPAATADRYVRDYRNTDRAPIHTGRQAFLRHKSPLVICPPNDLDPIDVRNSPDRSSNTAPTSDNHMRPGAAEDDIAREEKACRDRQRSKPARQS
jgi:hypothetical protein